MNDVEIVRRWQNLVYNDKAHGVTCPLGHGIMFPLIEPQGGGVFFECLVCENKVIPGIDQLQSMHILVSTHMREHSVDCKDCLNSADW